MRNSVFEEIYKLGGREFSKRLNIETGEAHLSADGQPLSLVEWNRHVNQFFPMSLKSEHSQGLIRWKERSRIRSLSRLVTADHPKVVADVGCEAGHISALILPHVEKLYCVDVDHTTVAEAEKRLASNRVEGVISDVTSIALPDGVCDAVLAASILEHVTSPEEAIAELKRIVRPGGRLVVSVPYDLAILRIKHLLARLGLAKMLGPLARGLAMGHVQIYTRKRFTRLIGQAGTIVRSGFLPPFCLDIYAIVRV